MEICNANPQFKFANKIENRLNKLLLNRLPKEIKLIHVINHDQLDPFEKAAEENAKIEQRMNEKEENLKRFNEKLRQRLKDYKDAEYQMTKDDQLFIDRSNQNNKFNNQKKVIKINSCMPTKSINKSIKTESKRNLRT